MISKLSYQRLLLVKFLRPMTSNTDGPAMPNRLPHEASNSHPKPQENFQEGDDIYDDVNDFSYTWETNQPSDSDRQHMENDDDVHDVPDLSYSWELGASHCASAGIPNMEFQSQSVSGEIGIPMSIWHLFGSTARGCFLINGNVSGRCLNTFAGILTVLCGLGK